MNLNLRAAILSNVSNHNAEQLEATIDDALQKGEEKMLPGLGVFFEMLWKESDEQERQEILDTLEQSLKQQK
ncbi:small acid-soluble spore protein SspI [Halobacillus litoralis]|uniref:Small, acid-soluble spore protein I n=1 Tax=Halobacillus litoralis TaxID=45668 RepID=A0A845DQW1_9BACI|nr:MULTISPECIES: small acid-soluble spore protein SspI [Halobacillus]MCA1021853.1 small acid-soluble spore protein SspI [Halobacillus litoralis]MYL19991.1 small acid-soluble spore protein SspI [Halobacillus litoralis]MYL29128.1 small acid-soluble spore protein SspI [Halobacillus halophilus]MYL39020.1 small acid-soluble spore protein SspI [Halobacillus litoralis]